MKGGVIMQREKKLYRAVMKQVIPMTLASPGNKNQELLDYIKEKYKIPPSIIGDIIFEREVFDEKYSTGNINYLFAILDGIDHFTKRKNIKKYFEPVEIEEYSKFKYHEKKVNLSKGIRALKVNENQYIVVKDIDFLMDLRKANLLVYNARTQRPLKKRTRGDDAAYEIYLSKSACRSIQERYEEYKFIPNVITLNILLKENPGCVIDYKEDQLRIKNLNHFDVLDGYHRYYAICEIIDKKDPTFNYPVILQITCFDEIKARDFIFQEDHKTKMRKVDSATYSSEGSSIIVQSLVDDTDFPWYGQVRRNGDVVDFADLVDCVKFFYLGNNTKKIRTPTRIKLKTAIISDLTEIMAINPSLFERKWKKPELVLLFYFIKKGYTPTDIMNFKQIVEKIDYNSPLLKKGIGKIYVKGIVNMCGLEYGE